jgi:hypothetical protein
LPSFSRREAVSGCPNDKISGQFCRKSPGSFGDIPKFLEMRTGDWFDHGLRDRLSGRISGEWTVKYTPRTFEDGDRRDLLFYYAGPDGQALISAFFKINEHFAKPTGLPWQGIRELTKDMTKADDVFHIFLAKK